MSPRVVANEEWLEARRSFLRDEKDLTRARDELARKRRELPWERVDQPYAFDGAEGRQTLAELFAGRGQLIVYHFMFDPSWEAGCPHCSFWADNFDRIIVHLEQRDASMVAISRAPYAKLAAYRARMGWTFRRVSSAPSTFNVDYTVSFPDGGEATYNYARQDPGESEREGVSVFARGDDGAIYHTYSAYARGIDLLNTAYNYVDLLPKGRDEGGHPQFWVRRHDEYGR